jgi:hypothetical protein
MEWNESLSESLSTALVPSNAIDSKTDGRIDWIKYVPTTLAKVFSSINNPKSASLVTFLAII